MEKQIEKLVRLQQVDSDLRRLQESIAAFPERMAQLEHKLELQVRALDQTEKAVAAEEARRRRLESDLKDQQQKILKYREQSNSVKTNDQFRALQHEISFVEAEMRRIEDAQITSLIESDGLDLKRAEAKKDLESQRKFVEHEKQAASAENAARQQQLTSLRKEREGLRAAVEPGLLSRYDRLASSSRKTALARASGQQCLSCQMQLRPQFWNLIREGELLDCESCGRMLYYDPSFSPVPENAAAAGEQ